MKPLSEKAPLSEVFAHKLLSHTPSLEGQIERLMIGATHDVTLLLCGETGTGKTHLARLIHEHSPRRNHDLMVVPCGALSANLIESELFGHVRGAFTGADRAKVGKFEAVGEGTLLLDEIDTLGLEQQAKLMRVIETGAYEPVGSNTTLTCRARIIAASNWDLEKAVTQGKFRQDLYYRLNVLSFSIPPLRERVRDIPFLARGIVARFKKKYGKDLVTINADVMAILEAFPWPGNIRQLENVLQQAVLVCTGPELLREHLPQRLREFSSAVLPSRALSQNGCAETKYHVSLSETNGHGQPLLVTGSSSLAENCAREERAVIERALTEANNSRSQAARALGISRVTLYNKMKKYGITSVR